MEQQIKILDLSITCTSPALDAPPTALAFITLECEILGLKHTGVLFTDPLSESERSDLRWYLEEYWKWPYLEFAARGKQVEVMMVEVGKRLYQSVFESAKAQSIVKKWQKQSNLQHQISIVSDIPRVLSLPWELLHDGRGFLNMHPIHQTSIVRRLPKHEQRSLATPLEPPLRILLVTARPEGTGFIDPRSIARELVDEVQRQVEAGTIELEFLRPPTFSALRIRLRDTERPIHVLHFDGHGKLDQKMQQGILLFETNAGNPSPVRAIHLAEVLRDRGIRLVVLTACQSAMSTTDDTFSSVAVQLIHNGVPAVAAMSASVLIASATRYVEAFYHALAAGIPVPLAQEQARQALYNDPRRHPHRRSRDEDGRPVEVQDWWLPHFYQQRAPVLSPVRSPEAGRSTQPPQPQKFSQYWNREMPTEPRYGFSGRSRELLTIERHLLRGKLVVISGFGGIGKTALCREAASWLIRTHLYACACFHSFEHGNSASTLLGALGHLLGCYDSHYNPADTNAALDRLYPLIRERRLLIIADNLESILPGGNASLPDEERTRLWDVLLALSKAEAGVLLTTRSPDLGDGRLASPHTMVHLPLAGLSKEDAYQLATNLLKDLDIDRARAPYVELHTLLTHLDHHPLAIQLTLPALRILSFSRILTDFAELLPRFNDDTITGRNSSLLASLDYSLSRLTLEQRTLLLHLAPFEGGASEPVLLASTGIDETTWHGLRTTLEQAALISPERVHDAVPYPFLRFHPILTPYLRSLTLSSGQALLQRYAQLYHSLAYYLYFEDNRSPQSVRALVQRELPNLRHALALLLKAGELDEASDMAARIVKFLNFFGLTRERDELRKRVDEAVQHQTKREPVEPSQRPLTQAEYLRESGLGDDEYEQGNLQAAAVRFAHLLTRIAAQPAGDELGQGSHEHCLTLVDLARCFEDAGQLIEAEHLLHQAFAIIDALFTQEPENSIFARQRGAVLIDFGGVLLLQGKYTQAKQACDEALKVFQRLGDIRHQVLVLGQLGALAIAQRVYETARLRYHEALSAARSLGEPAMEARIWHQLGMVAEEQQQWDEAERSYRESLRFKESIGDVVGAASTCGALGNVTLLSDRPAEAERWYKRALTIFEQVQPDGPEHALTLSNLAALLFALVRTGNAPLERLSDAKHYAEHGLKMREQLPSSEIWTTLRILAGIAELEEQAETACAYRRRERETFASFSGNRFHIDQQWGELIAGIAATGGDKQAQAAIEAVLPELEKRGWRIADATRRIWAGERNWHTLAEGIDSESALLVLRVLETIEGEQGRN